VNLAHDGRFLTAGAGSDRVTLERTEARDWEAFCPISQADIDLLRAAATSDWVIRSTCQRVRANDIAMQLWYGLRVGDLQLDLRFHLPFDEAHWPFRLPVVRDHWKTDQLCLYRPLVFYTAFRSQAVLEQLYLSIRSLLEIGRYDGDVMVLSERGKDEIASNIPMLPPERLWVLHYEPDDFTGYVAAKYAILDWEPTWKFQPLVFLDPDIIVDAPIEPMLCALAVSDRMAAPIEHFSRLCTSPSVGASLLQLDNCSPRYSAGFNCGTLGIPNLAMNGHSLTRIRTVMVNHADTYGRKALGLGASSLFHMGRNVRPLPRPVTPPT
jgi:hypothetical protein